MQWSETSLLRAYLAHNDRMAILFCLSHLHYERRQQVQEVFPEKGKVRVQVSLFGRPTSVELDYTDLRGY